MRSAKEFEPSSSAPAIMHCTEDIEPFSLALAIRMEHLGVQNGVWNLMLSMGMGYMV